MKFYFLVSMIFCFSVNAFALDTTINLTTEDLNKAEIIARSRTEVATATRIILLQLRATGCASPVVTSPDMFEKREDYRFSIKSENCTVIPKTDKCEQGYSQRNLKANPNSSDGVIVGADKYIVCVKGSSDTSDEHNPSNK